MDTFYEMGNLIVYRAIYFTMQLTCEKNIKNYECIIILP